MKTLVTIEHFGDFTANNGGIIQRVIPVASDTGLTYANKFGGSLAQSLVPARDGAGVYLTTGSGFTFTPHTMLVAAGDSSLYTTTGATPAVATSYVAIAKKANQCQIAGWVRATDNSMGIVTGNSSNHFWRAQAYTSGATVANNQAQIPANPNAFEPIAATFDPSTGRIWIYNPLTGDEAEIIAPNFPTEIAGGHRIGHTSSTFTGEVPIMYETVNNALLTKAQVDAWWASVQEFYADLGITFPYAA